jgi:superfamily II DNA or RNA helicase
LGNVGSNLIQLAHSIQTDTKSKALLTALEIGFSEQERMGARRKALIFTESRRTQDYLRDFLERNGYANQVVTFSGTNSDRRAQDIYERWLVDPQSAEQVTGSRAIDVRAALIEEFRDHASIMIATEAAAEGVNLQFCSQVINYDLPWNPQRIEQRIGRCHRYGQTHDVIVVNFLNERNDADKRVHALLTEKFNLFDGVFGASDEVLGTIESGVDFEKRILAIYQDCRTPEAIAAAFDELQTQLEEQIRSRMEDTRFRLVAVERPRGAVRLERKDRPRPASLGSPPGRMGRVRLLVRRYPDHAVRPSQSSYLVQRLGRGHLPSIS